jgi:uncharacterized membrane protein
MLRSIRKYFITGLIVTLPIIITFWIIRTVFFFLDGLLGRHIRDILEDRYLEVYVPGMGLVLSILLLFLIGFFVHKILGRKFTLWFEQWFSNLPLIKHIYSPTKQVVDFLFGKHKANLKEVVLVEYPRKGIYSIGFLTRDLEPICSKATGQELSCVIIPSTPNPITAFTIFVPRNDLLYPDMSIQEGLNLIISGGIVSNNKTDAIDSSAKA